MKQDPHCKEQIDFRNTIALWKYQLLWFTHAYFFLVSGLIQKGRQINVNFIMYFAELST